MKIVDNLCKCAINHSNVDACESLNKEQEEAAASLFGDDDIQTLINSLKDIIGDDYEAV